MIGIINRSAIPPQINPITNVSSYFANREYLDMDFGSNFFNSVKALVIKTIFTNKSKKKVTDTIPCNIYPIFYLGSSNSVSIVAAVIPIKGTPIIPKINYNLLIL